MAKNLTSSQAARQMGCTLDWIYRELRANRFAGAKKFGKEWQIPISAIRARLRRRKELRGE